MKSKMLARRTFLAMLFCFSLGQVLPALADRRRRGRREHHDDHDDDHGRRRPGDDNQRENEASNDDEARRPYDHESAADARRSGDIAPLRDILDVVAESHPGEIVGLKFEMEVGVWVYEITLVSPEGKYLEVYVNAKTKQIIKVGGQ